MLTAATTSIVVIHYPLARSRLLRRHACANRDHDTAGLVAGDYRFGSAFESRAGIAGLETGAIDVQVTAAHTRRLYLEHHIARARRGIGKIAQLELPVTNKHHALHANLLPSVPSTRAYFSCARLQLTTARPGGSPASNLRKACGIIPAIAAIEVLPTRL